MSVYISVIICVYIYIYKCLQLKRSWVENEVGPFVIIRQQEMVGDLNPLPQN